MEMYYLIVAMWTYSTIIIPEKYHSLDECRSAGDNIVNVNGNKYYSCVPAPKSWKCMTAIPGTNTTISTDCSVETGK